jgi:hypothetical protein
MWKVAWVITWDNLGAERKLKELSKRTQRGEELKSNILWFPVSQLRNESSGRRRKLTTSAFEPLPKGFGAGHGFEGSGGACLPADRVVSAPVKERGTWRERL